jgi:hypothetical protein
VKQLAPTMWRTLSYVGQVGNLRRVVNPPADQSAPQIPQYFRYWEK